MKLKVIGNYRNEPANLAFTAGMVVEVDDKTAAMLMADSPGSFDVHVEPEPEPTKATKRVKA